MISFLCTKLWPLCSHILVYLTSFLNWALEPVLSFETQWPEARLGFVSCVLGCCMEHITQSHLLDLKG